jgi:hypothetical protein
MNSLAGRYFILLVVIVQCCIWMVVKDDPFFGDAIVSTSRAATHIYDHGLATVFYPPEFDPGHPTLYPYILAAVWKVFGRTLAVSHLYACLWALLLAVVFRKIAALYLHRREVNIATLLLFLFPTYLSQSAMMLPAVALTCFFLLGVYGVLKDDGRWIIVGAGLMCITHLQSTFLLLSLCSLDLYMYVPGQKHYSLFQWIRKRLVVYGVPFLLFTGWLYIHYRHTGWLFVSPHYSDKQELNGLADYIKAILLMVWRLIDYGMLPFYLVLAWAFMMYKQSRHNTLQLVVAILSCCIAMAVFLVETIGHRYFMPFAMMAIIIALQALQYLDEQRRNILYGILAVSLLAGNFLVYPGKDIGDATLAYRGYFPIEKQLRTDFDTSYHLYSHAPVANPSHIMFLDDHGRKIERIDETPFDSLPVIVQSNVSAEFTYEQKKQLAETWYGTSYECGGVYVNVFLNPRYYDHAPAGWKLREPGAAEQHMEKLKRLLKH